MTLTTTTTDSWIRELFSDRAVRTGPGMVGIDPKDSAKVIAFGGGYPDASSLPIQDIIESSRIALERDGEWALQYAFGSGVPELVDVLLDKLRHDQGITASTENVLITNGASQALGLIFEAFVNPGDTIISEAPFFLGAVHRCRASGARVEEISLNDDGLDVEELRKTLDRLKTEGRQAKFLYLVPNFQNPTGITYSEARRRDIIELCQVHGVMILEDDAYYDLRFEGEPVPTFYSLAVTEGLVMYCGTFSKIIGAGMRLGWVIAHPTIIAHLSGLKTDAGTPAFASHVVAEFTGSGTLTEHIVTLKNVYRHRRDVMLGELERTMPSGTSWTNPTGGFFIWLTLPEGVNCQAVAAGGMEQGLQVGLGTNFFTTGKGERNVRLSYSFNDDDEIRKGVEILANVICDHLDNRE
ncbi:PLP-dependent aminotransferase family protein [soil metagenome]